MASYSGSTGFDACFELNEFQQPKLSSEIELIKNVVLFVLFAKPGQYPSLPTIGMDIGSLLYNNYKELDVTDLQKTMTAQCAELGFYIQTGAVQFRKTIYQGQPSLLIHIDGKEAYPEGYLRDTISQTEAYMIGITFDELNRLVYNVGSQTS